MLILHTLTFKVCISRDRNMPSILILYSSSFLHKIDFFFYFFHYVKLLAIYLPAIAFRTIKHPQGSSAFSPTEIFESRNMFLDQTNLERVRCQYLKVQSPPKKKYRDAVNECLSGYISDDKLNKKFAEFKDLVLCCCLNRNFVYQPVAFENFLKGWFRRESKLLKRTSCYI